MVAFVKGNGLRPGYVVKVKGDLYRVMVTEHRTPGKGQASMQAKLRKLKDGTQTEMKFRSDESVERAEMEQIEMEYLYDDPAGLCFMNCETYEQIFHKPNLRPHHIANLWEAASPGSFPGPLFAFPAAFSPFSLRK